MRRAGVGVQDQAKLKRKLESGGAMVGRVMSIVCAVTGEASPCGPALASF